MSTFNLQNELQQYRILEERILRRIVLLTQVIQKLEDNERVYEFAVPYIGPSQDQVYSIIGPDIKAINAELVKFRTMWKSVHSHIEELKFKQFKEYTLEDIERFHSRAKNELRTASREMLRGTLDDSQKRTEKLLAESDGIIRSLCRLLRREPVKKNMKLLLSELGHNLVIGDGSAIGEAFETLSIVTSQRLKYANDNYRAETNHRELIKLIVALEDAQIFMTDSKNPLVQQVDERISRIRMLGPPVARKRKNRIQ